MAQHSHGVGPNCFLQCRWHVPFNSHAHFRPTFASMSSKLYTNPISHIPIPICFCEILARYTPGAWIIWSNIPSPTCYKEHVLNATAPGAYLLYEHKQYKQCAFEYTPPGSIIGLLDLEHYSRLKFMPQEHPGGA